MKPVVLVLAGHDPSGAAGIQADIESLTANGCHAATVLTCMTTQNTACFKEYIPVRAGDFLQQVDMVLEDMPITACKIGLAGDTGILAAIEKLLLRLHHIPVVIDPVIGAGSGASILTADLVRILRDKILPRATVITPNSVEARALSGQTDLEAAGTHLLNLGCQAVLITGTHEPAEPVINTLFLPHERPEEYSWDRLPGSYHGSGCTLSSAIAAQLALGAEIRPAIYTAQQYTWTALKHGVRLGQSQSHPDRFFSA